jgi:hypothetical protein
MLVRGAFGGITPRLLCFGVRVHPEWHPETTDIELTQSPSLRKRGTYPLFFLREGVRGGA